MEAQDKPRLRAEADPAGALLAARRYLEAWNRHDPAGIVATFVEGGTYQDPVVGAELSGPAIGGYAGGLFAAFPNLSFDLVNVAPAGEQRVVAEWLMRGTNSGPLAGNPPTGRDVALPGVDLIDVVDGQIQSVRGYFDQKSFLEQLGLQVIAQPRQIGPFTFGTSLHVGTGKRARPGAVSLTCLEVRSEDEVEQVRTYSRRILTELLQAPGFISFFGGVVGTTLFTVTAWDDLESPGQLLRGGTHQEAMRRFFGPDFAVGGTTTVWAPHQLNRMWVRCTACGQMADTTGAAGACSCGEQLPEHPPYW